MSSCAIRVLARFRPLSVKEKNSNNIGNSKEFSIKFVDEQNAVITNQGTPTPFAFDKIFSSDVQQENVFNVAALQTVDQSLDGFNGTIFAYGQTGSGKTYTMFGPDESGVDHVDAGIIPRAAARVFECINNGNMDVEYSIKCSFYEVYMEQIRDLLNNNKNKLKIRESKTNGIWIEGITEEFVGTPEEILDLVDLGMRSRAVSATNMNLRSSRSHSILTLSIEQRARGDNNGTTKRAKLHLVDLAGSEKILKTGVEGKSLEEAKKINQSLSALGNCIHALTEAKRDHIPFRDSKLTRVLQESLGGNSKTTLLVTCSPHPSNAEETLSTLRFGQRVKTIKNIVKANVQRSTAELQAMIHTLTSELAGSRSYSHNLEKIIEQMKDPNFDRAKINALLSTTCSPGATNGVQNKENTENCSDSSLFIPPSNPDADIALELIELKAEMQQLKESSTATIDALKEEIVEVSEQLKDSENNAEQLRKTLNEQERTFLHAKMNFETEKLANAETIRKLKTDIFVGENNMRDYASLLRQMENVTQGTHPKKDRVSEDDDNWDKARLSSLLQSIRADDKILTNGNAEQETSNSPHQLRPKNVTTTSSSTTTSPRQKSPPSPTSPNPVTSSLSPGKTTLSSTSASSVESKQRSVTTTRPRSGSASSVTPPAVSLSASGSGSGSGPKSPTAGRKSESSSKQKPMQKSSSVKNLQHDTGEKPESGLKLKYQKEQEENIRLQAELQQVSLSYKHSLQQNADLLAKYEESENKVTELTDKLRNMEATIEQQQKMLARSSRIARIVRPNPNLPDPRAVKFEFGQFQLKKTFHSDLLYSPTSPQ